MHARTGSRSTFDFPQNDLLWENKKIDSRPPNHTTILHALRFSYPVCPEPPQPYRRLTLYLPYTHELPCTTSPASLAYPIPGRETTLHLPCTTRPTQCLSTVPATKSDRPTLHPRCPLCGGLPYTTHSPGPKTVHPSDQVQPAYPTPSPPQDDSHPEGDRHPTRPSPDGLPYTRPRHPLRGPVSRGIHWGNLGEGRLTLSRS